MLGFLYFNLTFCLFLTPPPLKNTLLRSLLKGWEGKELCFISYLNINKNNNKTKAKDKIGG
jgi:hypothetical protein